MHVEVGDIFWIDPIDFQNRIEITWTKNPAREVLDLVYDLFDLFLSESSDQDIIEESVRVEFHIVTNEVGFDFEPIDNRQQVRGFINIHHTELVGVGDLLELTG